MKTAVVLTVYGLLFEVTQAIECYNCVDCEDDEGFAYDCSILNADSCFLSKTLSTGAVTKTCGVEGFNIFGITDGCHIEEDVLFCRCWSDFCNTEDLFSTFISSTKNSTMESNTSSTSMAMTTMAGGFQCYQCHNCGSSVGVLTDCSTSSQSKDCYFLQEPNNAVHRSCGTTSLDQQNIPNGCNTLAGYTICKCSESGCNEYREVTQVMATPTRRTTLPPSITTTTRTDNSRWFCYFCQDCGASIGELVECTAFSESPVCYYTKTPSGRVDRFCGGKEPEEYNAQVGCEITPQHTVCKCLESECNAYEHLFDNEEENQTTTTVSMTTDLSEPWFCYVCSNCQNSAGTLTDCRSYTASRSCYLLQSPSGSVSRSCGSDEMDKLITGDEGCASTPDGQICKCSTSACNSYEDHFNSGPGTQFHSTTPMAAGPQHLPHLLLITFFIINLYVL